MPDCWLYTVCFIEHMGDNVKCLYVYNFAALVDKNPEFQQRVTPWFQLVPSTIRESSGNSKKTSILDSIC